jgi:hypothetical protein
MEPTAALAPEVSISHLLLHEHFLNWDPRVVNGVDLPAHGASLVAAGQWAATVSVRPHSLPPACCLSLTVEAATQIVVREVFSTFVPHKACKGIPLHELSIGLIWAYHIELLLRWSSVLLFLEYLKFTGNSRSRHRCRLMNRWRLWLLCLILVRIQSISRLWHVRRVVL